MEEDLVVNQEEVLEQTNETENTGTQAVEEVVEEVEDTSKGERRFTQEELNEIVSRRVARAENRVKREFEERYSKLDNTLSSVLGTKSPEESADKLTEFYKNEGINIPEQPRYSERDIEILAKAEADNVINSGYDDIVEEVDRLANKGFDNMTQREKLYFKTLAEERQRQEEIKDLASIGVKDNILNDKSFKEFANKFDRTKVGTREIYEMYEKTLPSQEVKPIGSMKSDKKEEKEYYTDEEISKMSMEDLDNDSIWNKVRASMTRKE